MIRDITSNTDTRRRITFSSYSKDDILDYLQAPENNASRLRDVSIQMFNNSTQYRQLVEFYSLLPTWSYIIAPLAYNPLKANKDTYLKQYTKASQFIEMMNIPHEMSKAMLVTLREGVFFGAIWKTNTTWFIQRINPDICELSSVDEGTWVYSVDMSKLKKEDLKAYPSEFTTMFNQYESSGQKLQEVPPWISFCLKADETTIYPIPPFASVLPAICDLETCKELAGATTEIENYKLLTMKVPTKDGQLTIPWDLILEFYRHLANAVPPNIGIAAIPAELDSVNFEKSGIAQKTDEIEQGTRNFWYSTGTSPLLFGDASSKNSSALALSIKAAEKIVFPLMLQCQRLINRHLKLLPGALKFKIDILPVTIFNYKEMAEQYMTAATLGLPTKQAYAATLRVQSADIMGISYLENEVLDLSTIFIPLQSTHTQPATGAPEKDDEDLSDSGSASRDGSGDDNKGVE